MPSRKFEPIERQPGELEYVAGYAGAALSMIKARGEHGYPVDLVRTNYLGQPVSEKAEWTIQSETAFKDFLGRLSAEEKYSPWGLRWPKQKDAVVARAVDLTETTAIADALASDQKIYG